ncbi:glycosyl transferase [Motiliproteus coralliicola]|uniref:Glycosyl transferase n=1 Tax=Motiliproteus coralliicola TaxID=2283196 RepID=A0A369WP45_9GAMM|nr:glycosyltransferase family 4 protein [Motiliproteus coralliicola]RDE22993.1 glycosyl transferase [Motiliproteus coralliicola]
MSFYLLAILLFVLALMIVWPLKRYAANLLLIDIPNERSSHVHPTPRGGGIAIWFSFSLALIYQYDALSGGLQTLAWLLLIGGGLIALVGLLDDCFNVPVWPRFSAHLIVALMSVAMLEKLPTLPVLGGEVSLGWVGYGVYALLIVWTINLYNFMDGIDGIASAQAVCVALGAALVLLLSGRSDEAGLLTLLAVCCFAFLVWNWPPAKIFMGDVGSAYLGFVIAIFAIVSALNDGVNIWTWMILMGVFWVDATCTLLWRMASRQSWHEAHRSHVYQVMARQWRSHKKVTLSVIGINVFWLYPWAVMTVIWPQWAFLCVLVSSLPLVYLVFRYGLGKTQE